MTRPIGSVNSKCDRTVTQLAPVSQLLPMRFGPSLTGFACALVFDDCQSSVGTGDANFAVSYLWWRRGRAYRPRSKGLLL